MGEAARRNDYFLFNCGDVFKFAYILVKSGRDAGWTIRTHVAKPGP